MAGAATPLSAFYCCSGDRPRLTKSPATATATLLSGTPKYSVYGSVSQLGPVSLSPWTGLKRLGITYRTNYSSSRRESNGRCKGRVVYASLFGVGAPEALVIGVVALLVFGPKGLAEVARTLGKTLRAFQPTIRELQDVSREFKSTLEREIGLDELASTTKNNFTSVLNENPKPVGDPNGSPATTGSYTSEELLKITEKQLDAASETGPQARALNLEEQIQGTPPKETARSEIAATPAAPEPAPQEPMSKKTEDER